ncbi:Gamma-interferon-inducible lysosomal thiol reductase [Armadillidium nasatum]|uniref:Gamma-interferon-inducible lysosomal thiol reductase n=1 Tax=Armadillidium nasatum TaxID=96803 RepID=A0A5N5SQR2_9CRUS|nr:Gamma-interferon-inducible lysosomal thiol reductase [Armadillidium nasatum]
MGVVHKSEDVSPSPGDHFTPLFAYKSWLHIWTTVLLVWVLALVFISEIQKLSLFQEKSSISPNGRKTFTCQHGPRECKANIMHACVSKHVKDEQTRLNIIECMIKINYNEDPIEAGRKCLNKFEENFKNVEKCATAEEGEELHYHMGKMTHDLEPRVTFIPTITINDSQKHQELILKNLVKKLCLVLTGPTHPACGVLYYM